MNNSEVLISNGDCLCEKTTFFFCWKMWKCLTWIRGYQGKEHKIASNGGVECGSFEKFQRLNGGLNDIFIRLRCWNLSGEPHSTPPWKAFLCPFPWCPLIQFEHVHSLQKIKKLSFWRKPCTSKDDLFVYCLKYSFFFFFFTCMVSN